MVAEQCRLQVRDVLHHITEVLLKGLDKHGVFIATLCQVLDVLNGQDIIFLSMGVEDVLGLGFILIRLT